MDEIQKDKIFAKVKESVLQLGSREHGGCFYYSHFGAQELFKLGQRVVIQAGSLQWPRITPKQDDGICSTHFSYLYQNDPIKNRVALLGGKLPEIHIWLGLPDTQELIDFSTGELVEQCQKTIGQDWPGPKPPSYLWGGEKDMPNWVYYEPTWEASIFAMQLIISKFGFPDYLKPILKENENGSC